MASNSYDSALLVATISQMVETVLANKLAPLSAFTTDFSDEVRKPADTIQVPIVSAASATSVNPTTFNPALATTVGKATVTLQQIAQFFHLSNADLLNARRLEHLAKINLDAFADKIFSLAITPITTTNFGEAVVTTTAITPGSGHLPILWAAVSKSDRKSLILSPTIYSQLIPTNRDQFEVGGPAYGFDAIYYASSFTGAVSGLDGFAISDKAIAVAAARPALDPAVQQLLWISENVMIESLGLDVTYNIWADTSTRQINASVEVMFGASAALTTGTAGLII